MAIFYADIPDALHKALKDHSAKTGLKIRAIAKDALTAYLKAKKGGKP